MCTYVHTCYPTQLLLFGIPPPFHPPFCILVFSTEKYFSNKRNGEKKKKDSVENTPPFSVGVSYTNKNTQSFQKRKNGSSPPQPPPSTHFCFFNFSPTPTETNAHPPLSWMCAHERIQIFILCSGITNHHKATSLPLLMHITWPMFYSMGFHSGHWAEVTCHLPPL